MSRLAKPSLTVGQFLAQQSFWIFLALSWMGLVFYFSSVPNSFEQTQKFFGDINTVIRKLAHFTEYGILTILFWQLWSPLKRVYTWAILSSVAYAISDEFHQRFVVGRGSSPVDVLIDSCGACFAIYLISLFEKPRRT